MLNNVHHTVICLPQLQKIIPKSRTWFWRQEREGDFPKRIKLSKHSVGWNLHEVEAWISSRAKGLE